MVTERRDVLAEEVARLDGVHLVIVPVGEDDHDHDLARPRDGGGRGGDPETIDEATRPAGSEQ